MKRTYNLILVFAAAAALATFAQNFYAGAGTLHAGVTAHAAPAPPATEPQRQVNEFRLSEALAAGRTLEIRGVNGVHMMAYRQEEAVAEVIESSGVLGGRVPWYPGRDKMLQREKAAS